MSWRQHIMALFLAGILLAVVIATAAKSQNPAIAASQVEVWIESPAPEALLTIRSNMTSRAKTPLQGTSPVPSYENASTGLQGAVWGQGPAYDLSRTSQTSIYVFYTPDHGE
jgi:hypothetical protein